MSEQARVRGLGTAALAVALTLVLSGCTLWKGGEDLIAEVQQDVVAVQALTALTDELKELDAVRLAESELVPVYRTVRVTVEMSDDASPNAIAHVATRVDEVLRGEALQPFTLEFSVRSGEVSIAQTGLGAEATNYGAELAYWEAVQGVLGAGLDLSLVTDPEGALQRILSTEEDAVVAMVVTHYDALTALVAPPAAVALWQLPGITTYDFESGLLPERSILSYLAAMSGTANLLDQAEWAEPLGVHAGTGVGQAGPSSFGVALHPALLNDPSVELDSSGLPVMADADWAGSPEWPLVLAAARAALDTGLPTLTFSVSGLVEGKPSLSHLYRGDCAAPWPPTTSDRALVAGLVAAGIPSTAITAGMCIEFAAAPPA